MAFAILDCEKKKFNDSCAVRVTTEGKLAPGRYDEVTMSKSVDGTDDVETYAFYLAASLVRTVEVRYTQADGCFKSAKIT